VSLRKEILNNRKKDFRSKVLKIEKRSRVKRGEVKKRRSCCASPSERPAHLATALCTFVYSLSFLHLLLLPVISVVPGAREAHSTMVHMFEILFLFFVFLTYDIQSLVFKTI
jgi:hypothetical protein